MIFTTTKTRVHAENETRLLSLTTDDSREQTARVLLALADEDEHGPDLARWHGLPDWPSTPSTARHPYAATRRASRRSPARCGDFGARPRPHPLPRHPAPADPNRDGDGRIVATVDDYAVVHELVGDVIAEGVGATVSDTVRETVAAVAALATARESPRAGRRPARVGQVDRESATADRCRWRLHPQPGGPAGAPGRWVIGDPLPETTDVLPQPCNLIGYETPGQEDGCTVAAQSRGESPTC